VALGVAILGSTGSIGRSALAVLERHRDRFRVVALAAHRNAELLAEQAARHGAGLAVLAEAQVARPGGYSGEWGCGRDALLAAARHPDADIVLNAVVGAAGLEATLAALEAGKRLALANKESLVAGGPLVLEALRRGGGELVPIDSEHSAILQCLGSVRGADVRRLILTASGGPFRGWTVAALDRATPAAALRHPTWSMGPKITVDSATLANKALEVIEAHFLFAVAYDAIEVVVHPQSIIHSMVEFADGSVMAQMGFPTMELPILYALTYPERVPDDGIPAWNPVAARELTFEAVDVVGFPMLGLGVQAGRAGGTAPAIFNAANEIAVAGFLAGNLPFRAIPTVVEAALAEQPVVPVDSLDTVMEADRRARAAARGRLDRPC